MIDKLITSKLPNQKEFTKLVETMLKDKRCGVMEAIVATCEKTGIDPSDCSRLLSASLKAKLEAEAMSLNLIPRGNQLPL